MNRFLPLLIITVLFGCNSTTRPQMEVAAKIESSDFEPSIKKVFDTHGTYDRWNDMESMEYILKEQEHRINLKTRNVRIDAENWTIGSLGETVWIYPDTASVRDPRFYHNLYFYFVAMPFVLGDPGISYEVVDDKVLRDTVYSAVKISFADGIGDAPKDNYILCYDKQSNVMKWLLYTVTYGEDVPNENFGLINYADWATINGLLLPSRLVWFKYDDGKVGSRRSEAIVSNRAISSEPFVDSIFFVMQGAKISD